MELKTFPNRKERAPWLLFPGVLLALSSVTFLAPHRAAQAAPTTQAAPKPTALAYDDGDGDELLEHWGDPKYVREERLQSAGIAVGFVFLAGYAYRNRSRRHSAGLTTKPIEVLEKKLEQKKAA
jgi:hypothetical protein